MSLDHNAIRAAYPNATFIDDGLGVFDVENNEITIDQSLVDAARVELDKLNYQILRVTGTATTTGYINVSEQLDQLYRDMQSGKLGVGATTGEWYVGITSVKIAFPKPS